MMTTVTSSDLRMAEFLSLYKRCIAVKKLSDNSAKWFPKWFESYVRFHRLHTKESVEKIPVTEDLLIGFLRHLRDSKLTWLQGKAMLDWLRMTTWHLNPAGLLSRSLGFMLVGGEAKDFSVFRANAG